MLSRTAENLYWMARHIERAENTARVLDVAHRTSLLPLDIEGTQAYLWYAPLNITGCADSYEVKYGLARADAVTHYMALDPDNPASIYSCLRLARENARTVRGAITSEMWQVINDTWLELNRLPSRWIMKNSGIFSTGSRIARICFAASRWEQSSRILGSASSSWVLFSNAPTIPHAYWM